MTHENPFDVEPSADGQPPDFTAVRDHVVDELVWFVRALRQAGVDVPANASLSAARALVEVGFTDETRARAALEAALVSRAADRPLFDRLFKSFWRNLSVEPLGEPMTKDGEGLAIPQPMPGGTEESQREDAESSASDATGSTHIDRPAPATGDELATEADEGDTRAIFSPQGRGERLDSADVAATEFEGLASAMDELTAALASLRGRRWSHSGTDRPNVRRALRASISTGGTVLSVPRRDRSQDAVQALFLVDVSQSVLDTVDRGFLVAFLRAAFARFRSTRILFFDTDVREVTEAFDAESAAAAFVALEAAETEWGGGTQIGGALSTLREAYPRAVDRETVVFVVSDGLETGSVDELEAGMAWLSRQAATVLWLNPLAGSPGYEPVAQGMAAALPFVSGLFALTNPADIHELARQLRRQGTGGRIGYQYAP